MIIIREGAVQVLVDVIQGGHGAHALFQGDLVGLIARFFVRRRIETENLHLNHLIRHYLIPIRAESIEQRAESIELNPSHPSLLNEGALFKFSQSLHGFGEPFHWMGQGDPQVSFAVSSVHRAGDHPDVGLLQNFEAEILDLYPLGMVDQT